MHDFKWLIRSGTYTSWSILKLGKWSVGSVMYDSCTSQGDPKKYKASCSLPGIKPTLGHFVDEESAKAAVEQAVDYWLRKINMKEEEGTDGRTEDSCTVS